jgi:hypothetical protein
VSDEFKHERKKAQRRAKYNQQKVVADFLAGYCVQEVASDWDVYEDDIEDILRAHLNRPKKKRGRK